MTWRRFLALFQGLGPNSVWVNLHADSDGPSERVHFISDPDAGERAFASVFGHNPSKETDSNESG